MGLRFADERTVTRQLARMPGKDRKRLLDALRLVAADPERRHPFATEMVGRPGVWRVRRGDWRAVYRVERGDVVVDRVAHRREVYR